MAIVKTNRANNKTRYAEYAFGVALSFFIEEILCGNS